MTFHKHNLDGVLTSDGGELVGRLFINDRGFLDFEGDATEAGRMFFSVVLSEAMGSQGVG